LFFHVAAAIIGSSRISDPRQETCSLVPMRVLCTAPHWNKQVLRQLYSHNHYECGGIDSERMRAGATCLEMDCEDTI
jgi:hypothetical protein